MPQPPSPPFWTVNASGGGNHGAHLVGCHIASAQGVYTFYDRSWNPLGTFSGNPLSCSFNYAGINGWTVTLATAVVNANANGAWNTPDTGPEEVPPQQGDYTAQAGGGTIAEEKAASSAGYGKQ